MLQPTEKVVEKFLNDNRNKMVITHYSFLSLLTEQNLHMPSRWYVSNNTYPHSDHKYFNFYKNFFYKNYIKNDIQVVYVVDKRGIKLDDFRKNFDDICFGNKKINEITFVFEPTIGFSNSLMIFCSRSSGMQDRSIIDLFRS